MSEAPDAAPSGIEAAARGLCPRCGSHTLFSGWVTFSAKCRSCGLDFARFNVGDGPAAFLTLGIGTIIVALAIWLELAAEPPWWVHVVLWLPLTIAGVIGGLRLAKGWLLVSEYRRGAREHRIEDDGAGS